jgi:predicted dehydrogenase
VATTETIGVAIIGAGGIVLANHLPGLRLCPQARLVALCDSDPGTLDRAAAATGVTNLFADYQQAISHPEVSAVVIATPNVLHPPIALAAIAAGKHVLCEKPLALDLAGALDMYRAAEAAGVRHMTAFTYRFVPAMRYLKHLVDRGDVGTPYHFRAQRFQDWGDRDLRWRQSKAMAGTGELGDMLSHRIDYGHLLLGPTRRLVADTRRFIDVRQGNPSDVDDWVAMIARYDADVTGVLESTKLATGRGENRGGQDVVELNGSDGTIVYSTQRPLELRIGRKGDTDARPVPVPTEFLVYPGSPRDPAEGDPVVSFRYDQTVEFIHAIAENRPATPSFLDGARAQAVMDAAVLSASEKRWVDVPEL